MTIKVKIKTSSLKEVKSYLDSIRCDASMDNEKMHNCGCGEHEHDHDHCGCGDNTCGCEHEHGAIMVDLEDENGNVAQCEVVDGFEYKENDYVLVQNPEDGSVYMFKVVGEGDEGELVVPDDKEFEEVTAYYQSTFSEE